MPTTQIPSKRSIDCSAKRPREAVHRRDWNEAETKDALHKDQWERFSSWKEQHRQKQNVIIYLFLEYPFSNFSNTISWKARMQFPLHLIVIDTRFIVSLILSVT